MSRKKKFLTWLQRKEGEEIVGVSYNSFRCPYATFLKEEYGISVLVCRETFILMQPDGSELEYALPEWARWFSGRIDKLGREIEVTVSTALRLLEGLA